MPPPRGHGAGKRARPLRDDGKRARQAGVFRPCARAGLPRRRHPRARPVSPRRHGGGVRGDPRRRSPTGSRSACTATTTSTASAPRRSRSLVLRELGAEVSWHLPSRFEEGYGLSGETLTRLAGEETGLVLTVDCGITAVEEVAHAKELGLDVVVTDHHRPGETLPDCPVVATRPSDYPFPELCGTGVVYKLAQALGARRPRPPARPRRARHGRGRRPASRREPRPGRRGPEAARGHDEPRSASAHGSRAGRSRDRRCGRDRLPPCAADQRRRTARASGHRARAPPHGRPEGSRPARGRARDAQPRPPGGRGPDPARGSCPGCRVAGSEAAPPRLRACRRGLAPRGDRDRRVAARRALPPPRRAHRRRRGGVDGLRALDPGLRPARRARRLRGPARPLGRTQGGRRSLHPPGERRGLRRGLRRPRGGGSRRGGSRACRARGRRRARHRADARPLRGARAPGAVRAGEPRRHASRRRLRDLASSARWARASISSSR